MIEQSPPDQWREALGRCLSGLRENGNEAFVQVTVLAETDSTQDAAVGAEPGSIVTALRQTGGRGRQGRTWMDDQGQGIAATFVVPAERSGRLAIAAAVATAQVISTVLPQSAACGIKWPNDVLVNRQKIAGILVEQDEVAARVGIGINVHQEEWPNEITGKAISLAQAGVDIRRDRLLALLIDAFAKRLNDNEAALSDAFGRFDLLRNTRVDLKVRGRTLRGRIQEIRPLEAIVFEPIDEPPMVIPVAEATISDILDWPQYAMDSA